MDLEAELFAVLDALDGAHIEYAVCGGFAVAMHGHPRLTQDIDLLVQDVDLVRTRSAVGAIGYTLEGGEIRFDAGTPKERTLWRVSKAVGPEVITLDVMLVGTLFRDVWAARERFTLPPRTITVVSRDGLAKMKRVAARPLDLDDLRQLGLPDEEPNGS